MKYELIVLQDGIETVAYSGTKTEILSWFDFKEKSHRAGGYSVQRRGVHLYAWKKKIPSGTKRRWIFIRET